MTEQQGVEGPEDLCPKPALRPLSAAESAAIDAICRYNGWGGCRRGYVECDELGLVPAHALIDAWRVGHVGYADRVTSPPPSSEMPKPTLPATLRLQIWNAAVEAAALVVQPVPHVNEERTCGEVAAAIRSLARGPSTPDEWLADLPLRRLEAENASLRCNLSSMAAKVERLESEAQERPHD